MSSISQTLEERGRNYGEFSDVSETIQSLKEIVRNNERWRRLDPHMKEAIEMILHKIGRIVNGNPRHLDSWHDIAGYAQLAEARCSE